MRRGTIIGCIAAAVAALGPAPAQATFHEIYIQEIFPGSTANPGQDYVTLQMWAPAQNFVESHTLTVYDATGATIGNGATFPSMPSPGVPNGANQSTILIGAASTVVGATPDLVDADLAGLDPAGGAVCWANVDCASWGSFPGTTALPDGVTKSTATIDDGLVFVRKYTEHGCSTTLDFEDDTHDSNEDFAFGLPVPRNNASAPTEVACFNTLITGGPQGKTRKRKPTFTFESQPSSAPQIRCSVDDPDPAHFNECGSPFQVERLSLGRHTFYAAANNSQNGLDPTPAERSFKVVKRRR